MQSPLKLLLSSLLSFLVLMVNAPAAWAFCGFYVSKADTSLYNQASQVVIARDGQRTVLTMANDFQGDVKDFAIVVPVPVLLQKEQVKIGDAKMLARLDGFSAPRLVEYFDEDPCRPVLKDQTITLSGQIAAGKVPGQEANNRDLGVTVEAKFTVGEYDILILSAKESDGLETWLNQNDYKIPQGASSLLQPYIRQKLKFFVAKVNLGEYAKSDSQALRPLMMAFESPRFMLPIRLGMINAKTDQDLIVYVLSPKGQAEVTNYRDVNIPSNMDIPVFVKNEFGDFYKAMFQTAYERESKKAVFLEYAWDMASCDPCSAEPLNADELRRTGVFWLDRNGYGSTFLTRFHVRYTRDKFPEDLMFQETSNRTSFQGRYVLRHPFNGDLKCSAGRDYQRTLAKRFEQEAQTLAKLTKWDVQAIRRKMPVADRLPTPEPWWRNVGPQQAQ